MAMTLIELRDRLIEEGIESVNKDESITGRKRSGSVLGFELCRNFDTFESLDAEIASRERQAIGMISKGVDPDIYWGFRYATIQMEFVRDVLNVAVQKYPVGARAAIRYAQIVGVDESNQV